MTSRPLPNQRRETYAIRILRSEDPIHVPATEISPGLHVYRLPDAVNPGDLYRWRVGHHTGRAIAIAMNKQTACNGALAIADLTDWTEDVGTLAAGHELAKRLRRNNCYRAGY